VNPLLPFEAIAALRFLREGLTQTLLIIVGVSVGVAVIVFMSALLAGLQGNFIRRVLSTQAHIVLIPQKEVSRPLVDEGGPTTVTIVQKRAQRLRSIDQWQKIRLQIAAIPDIVTVSPNASGAGFAVRGDANRSISVAGVEPDAYFRIVNIPDMIVAGTARLTSQDILIGTELANDLGVAVGDKLRISTAVGGNETLTISGVFDLGNKGANQRNTFVALRTAQSLLNLIGGVSSIDVTVRDVYAANDVANVIEAMTGIQADSWIETNQQFFTAVRSQDISNYAIRGFVALSVALGVASVLVVSVVQRSREIGILRAMGASRSQIMRIFLLQGAIVAFTGSLIGSLIARGALAVWLTFARNPDGTEMFPVEIGTDLVLLAALLATVVGLLAAIMPARRAAQLDPVVAIRG
jgi:lipoprotein-releasing system permease protein